MKLKIYEILSYFFRFNCNTWSENLESHFLILHSVSGNIVREYHAEMRQKWLDDEFSGMLRSQSNIQDGTFCENSQ